MRVLIPVCFRSFWTYHGGPINQPLSVRSSVRLLPAFLEIGSLFFSDFWHNDAKWQCPKRRSPILLKRISGRKCWKYAGKNRFLGIFSRFHLFFAQICVLNFIRYKCALKFIPKVLAVRTFWSISLEGKIV